MNKTFRHTLIAAGVSAMLGNAIAQTAAPSTAADNSATLSTVVVTAQKRSQTLQEVPISMTVVGEDAMEKMHVKSLYDIGLYAPNFEAVQSPGWSTVTVRGVGGGGRNIGFDTRVGVYLDGVYVGQVQALDQSLGDIEQIEVLRGPQGHLFGRNTDAGAVNITTRAPSKTFEGNIDVGVGNMGRKEFSAYVTGPLAPTAQAKLSVSSETHDGFINNLYDGHKLDNLEKLGIRGQVSVQASQALKVDLYADYTKINQDLVLGIPTTGLFNTPLTGTPLPDNTVNFNTTPTRNSEVSGFSLALNYDLGGGMKLTSITGYRDTKQDRSNDVDYSANDIFHVQYYDHFKQTSEELRIASPNSGSLRYVAGLYYLNEKADTSRYAIVGQYPGLVPLPSPPFPAGAKAPFAALGLLPGATITNSGNIDTTDYALFGNLDYDLMANTTLNLGALHP